MPNQRKVALATGILLAFLFLPSAFIGFEKYSSYKRAWKGFYASHGRGQETAIDYDIISRNLQFSMSIADVDRALASADSVSGVAEVGGRGAKLYEWVYGETRTDNRASKPQGMLTESLYVNFDTAGHPYRAVSSLFGPAAFHCPTYEIDLKKKVAVANQPGSPNLVGHLD